MILRWRGWGWGGLTVVNATSPGPPLSLTYTFGMKWILALSAIVAVAQPIQPEKERALGRGLANELRREAGPADNPELAAFVQRVGQRLAGANQYEFSLIGPNGPSEPAGLPGQIILVPTSFFRQAADEAEFAALVAHAMAHSALHHGWLQPQQGATIPLYFGHHTLVPMAYREQARRNELEADQRAVEIIARAGYDAAALSTYLRRAKADPERLAALEQRTPPGGELGGTEFLRLQQVVGTPKPPTLKR